MDNEKIIVSVHLRNKLNKLVYILFEKEYFGYVELAQDYINKIYDFAYSIPNKKHHKTQNDTFGKWYVVYKPNKGRTAYYITFDKKDDRYLLKNIFTNHTKEYSEIIRRLK